MKQSNTMSQETKPQIAVDQGDVDWYLRQGLSEEDAKAEVYYDVLRDMSEDQHDDGEDADEDPLAGDVEPTGGYYEEPQHPFDAHRDTVMRQQGDFTG